MKTTLNTLVAALVMVPALAFAGSDSVTVRTTSETGMTTYEAPTISDGGIMTTDTTTTTVKRQRNARSDTEYGANSPSPGETDTRVFVRERVRFERNAE